MNEDPHPPARTFADCLNLLFEASATEDPQKPGQFNEYTNAQVAEVVNDRHGAGTITGEYIRRLRKGDIKSPSVQNASVLAQFFQVPLDTFNAIGSEVAEKVITEAQRFVDSRRRLMRNEQDPEQATVAVLARAARRLSPAGQSRAAEYIQKLEQLEQMENDTQAPGNPPD
ncbi:hypothetical protein OG345_42010 (plasmid) [Streptomyces sp. NBC_01220]|uniref:hypothetical protein n=1 Tax=Streptomyces sp. NBC_01220 TaxID=2903781 RepID=UPI00352DCE9D|nr:hypothetical protein OG345_42010 [Streptomyces sp. NBC_01220]